MRAQRIVRPATAFSLSSRRTKRPRIQEGNHLKWIRTLPCLITGHRDKVQAAHIRYSDPRFGKRETGHSEKSSDRWTVPLTAAEHEDQHKHDERSWWIAKGIDPVAVAAALYLASGDDDMAEVILREARPQGK